MKGTKTIFGFCGLITFMMKNDPDVIILRLARVAFGVNVSPFLLNATLQNHIRNYFIDQDFVKKLLDSFMLMISIAEKIRLMMPFNCIRRQRNVCQTVVSIFGSGHQIVQS